MTRASDIFGSDVFDLAAMRKRLPKKTYQALTRAIDEGSKLDMAEANTIAHTIMEWSLEKGATHYTHWFQPMTGRTAEKHDSFFAFDSEMMPIESFSGSQLIQSEPDASSFPSGGTRTTFEARGYTAWDPSSPVFIMMNGEVPVLCIPSVFFSYTGHALDKKTPLLRAVNKLNASAAEAVKLLTGKDVRVGATIGCEQEYFLVDSEFYELRPDLIMAERTLLGCRPSKGQQMEDHYFGSVKDRVLAFMADVEKRLYRLGVPCKTRHNEVAPHQYETAPIFEPANLAADHNQLVMEVIRKTADEHGMAALLHEKPFADVNGSGKHLNWSMATSEGQNLLEPGKDPHKNLSFLYFLVAVVNAVHQRGGLLRSTIASAGNDHRLGANEAPPAIMSVFLGRHLTGILNKLEASEVFSTDTTDEIDLGLSQLPDIHVDNTDRNRTSPFAFTGNKFEFRAVGSNQSISIPAAVLCAAVADSLDQMNAELAKLDEVNEASVFGLLRPIIKRSNPIRFEGDNYSDDWHQEAEKRGLPNNRNTPAAYTAWDDPDNRAFIARTGVLTEVEMDARTSVRLEHYTKQILIEAGLTVRMVDGYVLPPALRYQSLVADSLFSLKQALGDGHGSAQTEHLKKLSGLIESLIAARGRLEAAIDTVHTDDEDVRKEAKACAENVIPVMNEVRGYADEIESLVDADEWQLPSYGDLLYQM